MKHIDKIKHKGYTHYVYYKTPIYWLISRDGTKKHMFSVLLDDLKLNKKQKATQKELLISKNK